MTDSDVSRLKPGDVVHEETPKGCIRLIVTSPPEPPVEGRRVYRAWAKAADGSMVVGISHKGDFHLASLHKARVVTPAEARGDA